MNQESKEFSAVKKAREQYDLETCEHTKQRLKKFILTKCHELEAKGENCIDLYYDLQDGNYSSSSQKTKKIVIELKEFERLVKSDNELLNLTRKYNKLVLKLEKQKDIKDLELKITELNKKIENQKVTLARLQGRPIKPPPILLPDNEREKYETAKRVRDEYYAELSVYKKGFNELKKLSVEKNIPDILMIIQSCYFENDKNRDELRNNA